ncbi:uncharacterized protein CDAR_490161 [Caerostris darwini]|uniref:Uncharacterized protein n=1 Tax=Caerostris darwini TaxID=1538125 RepID=A0AAV4TLC4_9ARAC|nr:uncharacterized protein CDAR_490161 [Caerostris darwini]
MAGIAKVEFFFNPDAVQWEKRHKRLVMTPDQHLKNSDTRMGFKITHKMYLVKCNFSFGHTLGQDTTAHVYQKGDIPLIFYELPKSSFQCKTEPSLVRRSFKPYDQILYYRYILKSRTCCVVPSGVRYIILTVQKTLFALDILLEDMIHQLDFSWCLYSTHKTYQQQVYALPPTPPHHQPESPRKKQCLNTFLAPKNPRYLVPKSLSQNKFPSPLSARKKTGFILRSSCT